MAEIRLRDVSTAIMQKAAKCQAALHKKTITATVERLFEKYFEDQEAIRQLQQRNMELHSAISKYYSKDNISRATIQEFINTAAHLGSQSKLFIRSGKKLIKQFGKKKGR